MEWNKYTFIRWISLRAAEKCHPFTNICHSRKIWILCLFNHFIPDYWLVAFFYLIFFGCLLIILYHFTLIFIDVISRLLTFLLWCSFFTNTLILPVVNGPTEGLMLIYLVHCFTGIVGRPLLCSVVHDIPFYSSIALTLFCRISSLSGAEWWAQQFGKSIPIFSWVPFISGEAWLI